MGAHMDTHIVQSYKQPVYDCKFGMVFLIVILIMLFQFNTTHPLALCKISILPPKGVCLYYFEVDGWFHFKLSLLVWKIKVISSVRDIWKSSGIVHFGSRVRVTRLSTYHVCIEYKYTILMDSSILILHLLFGRYIFYTGMCDNYLE